MQNNKRQPQSTVTDGGIPIWDIQRIKVTLDSCDIPVSVEDIMKPNVNSSTGIFQGLLEVIMGIAAEDIEYSKASLLPTMKHQGEFPDGLYQAMFFHHCRELAQNAGVKSFCYADLNKPEPHRFRSILSDILNLAIFREDNIMGVWKELVDQREDKKRAVVEQEQENQHFLQAIEEIKYVYLHIPANTLLILGPCYLHYRDKIQKELPQEQDAERRNLELRQTLMALRTEQVALERKIQKMREERAEVIEKAVGHTPELSKRLKVETSTKLLKDNADLKAQIVRSPDRQRKEIAEMAAQRQELAASVQAYRNKTRDLGGRIDTMAELEFTNIEEDRRKQGALRRELQDESGKLTALEKDLKQFDSKIEQLDRQIELAGQKKDSSDKYAADMREQTEVKTRNLLAQYQAKNIQRADEKEQIDIQQQDKRRLEEEINAASVELRRGAEELRNEYRKVLNDFSNNYLDKIAQHLRLKIEDENE
ncbi:hypothetical protein QFC21_002546 [Naganishia friedmannii]|uniref:Uncharacterized protein n=1 Tax=Naganishia friedmannii TaxID=89922 RepID=A0ACC2VVU4_9TREE|nr:hypothetical protein QFC21_002546 [Naganishia friedmannii]